MCRQQIVGVVALAIALSLRVKVYGADAHGFEPLFPQDGIPEGWVVRRWDDVALPAEQGGVWRVKDGILRGSEPRGTWLVSEKDYVDFVLDFEWRLGERGNSGCGLRFPSKGDPAFDGLELQMVDSRYYGEAEVKPSELTGGLYRAVAPVERVYKPGEWNQYRITCRGPKLQVILNGTTVLDVNLDEQTEPTLRHDGSKAPPLKDRPRKGRIGFQELSRSGHVEIRNAKIKELR